MVTGIDGDYYLNTTTGDLYQKQSGNWVLIGNLKGSQGPTGPTEPQGTAGTVWYNGTGVPS